MATPVGEPDPLLSVCHHDDRQHRLLRRGSRDHTPATLSSQGYGRLSCPTSLWGAEGIVSRTLNHFTDPTKHPDVRLVLPSPFALRDGRVRPRYAEGCPDLSKRHLGPFLRDLACVCADAAVSTPPSPKEGWLEEFNGGVRPSPRPAGSVTTHDAGKACRVIPVLNTSREPGLCCWAGRSGLNRKHIGQAAVEGAVPVIGPGHVSASRVLISIRVAHGAAESCRCAYPPPS